MAVRFSGSQTLQRTANLPPGEALTIGGWGRIVTDTNNTVALAFLLGSTGGLAIGLDADGLTLMGAYNDGSARWTGRTLSLNTDFYYALTTSGVGSGQSIIYTRYVGENVWTSSSIAATRAAIGTQSSLQLGAVNAGFFYNGRMWNVKCWDRALTPEELLIESHYSAVQFPASINFHWDLARHNALRDLSGNGRGPTLSGTLTTEDGSRGLWKPSVRIFLPSAAPSVPSGVSVTPVDHQSVSVAFTPSPGSTRNDVYIRSTAARPSLTTQSSAPWHLPSITNNGSSQYPYREDGSGVNVYVFDTGMRITHNEVSGRAFFAVDPSGEGGTDEYDHGTGVASLVAGTTLGVAKGAIVHNVRGVAVGSWDTTYAATTYRTHYLACLDWLQANIERPAVVICSSPPPGAADGSGGADVTEVAAGWQAIHDMGVPCVIAAGNYDAELFDNPPYNMADVLQVGGHAEDLSFYSASAHGPDVDLLAPAVSVTVASASSNSATVSSTGTSWAAPIVAGTIAKLLQESPNATPARIRRILLSQAFQNTISGEEGGTPDLRLNANATATDWVLYEDVGASPYVIEGLEPNHTYEVEVESWVGGVQTGRSATASGTTNAAPVTLVVADVSQTQTIDSASLSQALTLAVAEAAQAQSIESPTLTQAYLLALAGVSQAQSVESPALTQAQLLAVQDAAQTQAVDNLALSVALSLVIAEVTQAQAAESVSLTQAYLLAIESAAQAQSVDAPTLTQAALLTAQDVAQAQSVDNVETTIAGALSVHDALQSQTVDALILSQAHQLAVQDVGQAMSVEQVSLSESLLLEVAAVAQAHSIDAPTLTQAYLLLVQDVAQAQHVDGVALTQASVLALADVLQAMRADNVTLRIPVPYLDRAILFAVPVDQGIYSVPSEINPIRVS